MPRIVDMHMRRGRPERFIIRLEDEQELVLTPEVVLKFGIAPDREFSDQEFLKILQEDGHRQAKDQAMRYLSNRPHSRLELVRKMREKGYRFEIINHALDDLEKIDLIDDRQFTRMFIQNELRLRPVGRMLLTQKLAARGISREMYEPLIKELFSEELELEIAQSLAKKFLKSHTRFEGKKLKEKLIRYLQGKGFTWEQIKMAVEVRNDG